MCRMFSFEGWKILFYGGLGISKLQYFIKKMWFFFSCKFFQFSVVKTLDPDWFRIGIQPKMLDQDMKSINPDPKHW